MKYQLGVKSKHHGIVARIVADSISPEGVRITTFELEYPRFIHSELLTHRLFSRNAASSRAIPIKKVIEMVRKEPAHPIHWGKNQSGMQANVELGEDEKGYVQYQWSVAARNAAFAAELMESAGAHKQIVNRILEPFQTMKTVVTATEFDNFFWLRCHADAQPEIKELADRMYACYTENEPEKLLRGDWHTPYVKHNRDVQGRLFYHIGDGEYTENPAVALKISASCCAQVSYRVLDDSTEKAEKIFDQLIHSVPVHASPVEHQAMVPEDDLSNPLSDCHGMTHEDVYGDKWSGNLRGWVQYRQLISNNTCWKFEP